MARLTFTEQLRRAALASELTQREIARRIGASEAFLSRFVRGESWIGTENLDSLADLLGLRVEQRSKSKRRR